MPNLPDCPAQIRLEIYKEYFLTLPTEDLMLPMHTFPLLRASHLVAVEGLQAAISAVTAMAGGVFKELQVANTQNENARAIFSSLTTDELDSQLKAWDRYEVCKERCVQLKMQLLEVVNIGRRLKKRLEYAARLRS